MHLTFTLHPKQSAVYNSLYMLAGMFPLTLQGTITLLVAALTLSVFGYGSLDLVVTQPRLL